MTQIKGVGPDAEIETNEHGASQSKMFRRYDLLPPLACSDIAEILAKGAQKYGEWSYTHIKPSDHLNHAIQHIFAYIACDDQEGDVIEHAKHAACRILFWLDCLEIEKENAPIHIKDE